jgi:hypothetical protein
MPCSSALFRKYRENVSIHLGPLFETGTEAGHGIVAALAAGVPRVYSVDINKQDQDFLRNHVFYDIPEVELFAADSPDWLGEMAAAHSWAFDRGLFWLDAHSANSAPILREIAVLAGYPDFRGVVMIDDMRVYRAGNEFAKTVREPDVLAALDRLPGKWERQYEPDQYDERDILVTWRTD